MSGAKLVCVRCGREGHQSGQCKWPTEASNARAHLAAAPGRRPGPNGVGAA